MNAVLSFDKLDLYYGAAASVESFKNFDQYGIIMVDSHGAATNGGGYICIPAPGNYDQQDIAEGHLVRSGRRFTCAVHSCRNTATHCPTQ